MDPLEAFRASDAAVAVVGAGGKKTTMYALAERLPRAVVTATVRIPIFDREVTHVETTHNPVNAARNASDEAFPLGLVPKREREDRYLGYDVDIVTELIAAHDGAVLIKADGARLREFKAPNDREPQIPTGTDVVVPVVSAGVIGEPLTEELVHRPERVAQVATAAGVDVAVGDAITPEVVGATLSSPEGGMKGVPPGSTVIPLVNQVDDADRETAGRAIAKAFRQYLVRDAVDRNTGVEVPHVVLARMIDPTIVATVAVDAGIN